MLRILVTDNLAPEGVDILRQVGDVEETPALTEDELCKRICCADALVVRSQTKVTQRVIEAADGLRVIGRAGVGVENIDVDAATRKGILVINAPAGNTIAAAELAIGLLLSLARRIPQAHNSVRSGEWNRSEFIGRQLRGKTLGIIGLGRIGTEVAKRASSLGLTLLGFDPMMSGERAKTLGVELVDLSQIYHRSDFITLHCSLTPETNHLINRQSIGQMKDNVYIVNCARGELIDEAGLVDALRTGKVAGAAIDTFEREPPTGSALLDLPNVIVTPHLGASTTEAQVEVAVDIATQVVDALAGKPPRYAINMPPIAPEQLEFMEPFLKLAERMGTLHTQLAQGTVERVELAYAGEVASRETDALKCAFLRGLLQPIFEEKINWVNAPIIAESRGVRVREHKTTQHEDYTSTLTATVITAFGGRELQGTVFGRRDPRIISIDNRSIHVVPEGYTLLVWNYDTPGMIGKIGTLLGEAKVNIAGMQVGRTDIGGMAVMALSVDSPVSDELVATIARQENILAVKQVDFDLVER